MSQLVTAAAWPSLTAETKKRPAASLRAVSGRAKRALDRRMAAARFELEREFAAQAHNGDQTRHDPAWVCYSKGLVHLPNGEAAPEAARHLWRAVDSGDPRAFENIPIGGYIKLANPQAAFAYDLLGPDPQQIAIPPAPAFSSAEQTAEMLEMYWHALTRDVPFAAYGTDPLIRRAAEELNAAGGYAGPRDGKSVTPANLFRGITHGGLIGPYVSQFLWRDLPWTPIRVQQKIRIAAPNVDYLTKWDDWLRVQDGNVYPVNDYEDTPRYIRTGRDLGEYVHRDFTYQAYLGACLMLFRMSAPLDGGIPYQYSISQSGFVTLGPSDILHVVATVANLALKASWWQKWAVHRRLRPEEYGGRVQRHASGGPTYPLHADLLAAAGPGMIKAKFGSYLLPVAYPEGAPLHPSYPAGHAVVAGACATALKACFAENFVIPNPQVPSADGLSLQPYRGPELTVGNELDKLAENISVARNFAGLHWRSDMSAGLRLGERVAINVLRELKMVSEELFTGYDLRTFDGKLVQIR